MAQSAIELLKKDHQKVRSLLEQLSGTTQRSEKKRQDLLEKIEAELAVHMRIEEEIFYPAFRDANGKSHQTTYHEAVEEHRAIGKLVLRDLRKTDPGSEQFAGRARVLKELVEHHIEDEEEEMLPEAENSMDQETLETLGEKLQARKKALRK
ncbi:MAG: hemerythrin domain-containing protein [Thiogranum sp.]|nr:hemerythrin domain-containing protein [Thiogranum sp.]